MSSPIEASSTAKVRQLTESLSSLRTLSLDIFERAKEISIAAATLRDVLIGPSDKPEAEKDKDVGAAGGLAYDIRENLVGIENALAFISRSVSAVDGSSD